VRVAHVPRIAEDALLGKEPTPSMGWERIEHCIHRRWPFEVRSASECTHGCGTTSELWKIRTFSIHAKRKEGATNTDYSTTHSLTLRSDERVLDILFTLDGSAAKRSMTPERPQTTLLHTCRVCRRHHERCESWRSEMNSLCSATCQSGNTCRHSVS
jgi:hypothetical protein